MPEMYIISSNIAMPPLRLRHATLRHLLQGDTGMETNLLFWMHNKHENTAGNPPQIDGTIRKRYHGYFENEFGEQAVFVFDYEAKEGTLWMGDASWENPFRVDGNVPELELGLNESIWLRACWETVIALLPK